MSEPWEKMIADAAESAAKDKPVDLSLAIKRLDKHLSGENAELWLAWCSVRTAFLKETGAP